MTQMSCGMNLRDTLRDGIGGHNDSLKEVMVFANGGTADYLNATQGVSRSNLPSALEVHRGLSELSASL